MPTLLHAAGFLIVAVLLGFACSSNPDSNGNGHDNVGVPCDILTDAGPKQGVFNVEALECTSRICLKPVDYVGGVDTWPSCSATCSQDSDCIGLIRDASNPNDKACVTGYTCGVAFTHGRLCCAKLCLCMDFYGGPVSTPDVCGPGCE